MKRAEEVDLKGQKKKSNGFLSHEERADTSNEDQKIILSPFWATTTDMDGMWH